MPPIDNSPEAAAMRLAQALTDEALAQRLDMFVSNRRTFTRAEADAFITVAARRLRWGR